MSYAYWYLFIAFLLPYVFTILAKAAAPGYDNSKPREFLENLEGWRKRSHWVQLNSYEIFPPFAAAVIIAHQLHINQAHIDLLAFSFLGFRILYGIFYIADKASFRTLSFLGSLFSIVGLFIICM